MFKRAAFSTFFLLCLCAFYLFYCCFYIVPKDIKNYEKSLEKAKHPTSQKKEILQQKKEIQKDIWEAGVEPQRLHYRIQAERSELKASPYKGKYLVKEAMENIECWIQDRGETNNSHQLKRFTSNKGIYQLHPLSFVSEKVDLSFYILPLEECEIETLITPPYLKGQAKKVTFKLLDKKPFFHAERFKAQSEILPR